MITKILYYSITQPLLFIVSKSGALVLFFITALHAFPHFSPNDAFQLFPWTRQEADTVNYGYKLVSKINSQVTRNDSLIVDATVRVAGLPQWLEKVKTSYGSLEISFTDSKPPSIVKCSQVYENCPWLAQFSISLDNENHTIRFPFPVPDDDNTYQKYSYFTVAVNDSVHLQFQGVEDSIFMGSFLNDKRQNEPEKWLMAKGAVMVRTSNRSPLRIHNIELNADHKDLITSYLGADLSQLSTDCNYYGIDFMDTTITEQIIQVSNVSINSSILHVDSTYTVSWTTEGKEAIQTCSLYVKFDNGSVWIPYARTEGDAEQHSLEIPINSGPHCAVKVRAIGHERQNATAESELYPITTGSEFKLHANALNNSSALLQWDPQYIDTTNAKALVIAYRNTQQILSYPAPNTDTVHYSFQTSSDIIGNLEKGVLYQFAAFILTKDGSYIPAGEFARDSALIIDNVPPENNFQLLATADTASVLLTWESILDLPDDADSIGIFVCEFRYPVSYNDSSAVRVTIAPAAKRDSFKVKDLKPDQNYYFALMIRDSSGNWAEPSEYSIARARIVSNGSVSNSSPVVITPADTQYVFNDSLLIWNTTDITFTDTIDNWSGPQTGFATVGPGYQFRNGDKISKPLWVQVAYPSAIEPKEADRIRLYSYDIYKGGWILTRDSVKLDSDNHTVAARVSVNSNPFMFLIDTLAPVVEISGNTEKAVNVNQLIQDTILVTDNIKNSSRVFLAGPGNTAPWEFSSYVRGIDTVSTPQKYEITFPPGLANSCTGLRAQLTVSDGLHDVTVNLSKPVRRENDNCDNFTTTQQQWTPLVVSAIPDNPDLGSVMSLSSGESRWAYEPKKMRIVKWISGHPEAFDNGWVEYNTAYDSLFRLQPGSMFWVRTGERFSIDFGNAVVPRFSDTLTVSLQPGAWTDFSNPFPFDIHIGDILETSLKNPDGNGADSLEFYIWNKRNSVFETEPVYLTQMPGINNLTDTLKSSTPYSVYNPTRNEVILHIPPVCVPASTLSKRKGILSKRKQNKKGWSIRIDSWGDNRRALPAVYCGQNPVLKKEITYKQSPSFSDQRVSVYDSEGRISHGAVVKSQGSESGIYYELLFTNNSSSPSETRAVVGDTFNIDNRSIIRWYDREKNQWVDAADTLQISLKAKQSQVHVIAVGDEQYFDDIGYIIRKNELMLRSIYPNPFTRSFNVKYSLPGNAQQVNFYVFNLKGQMMWSRELVDLRPGPSTIKMNEQLAAGLYMLQMRVKLKGVKSTKILKKAIICVR